MLNYNFLKVELQILDIFLPERTRQMLLVFAELPDLSIFCPSIEMGPQW